VRESASRERVAPAEIPTILVMSGTEPAPFLNAHVPPLLGRLRRPLRVIHQTAGEHDEDVRARYAAAGIEAEVAPYFDAIETVYARTDLAITRAGASTIAELALCGIPSVLVPNPGVAADHQTENVRAFDRTGGVPWFAERDWHEERVAATVASLLEPATWREASVRIRGLAAPEAAQRLAGAIIDGAFSER
jgi:UDP-N-acetylglucosamine--N-acetylmuramyl-(pentapeptide) pyrophosphoryl-undecaprenol N-acetylglucosamine transferase